MTYVTSPPEEMTGRYSALLEPERTPVWLVEESAKHLAGQLVAAE